LRHEWFKELDTIALRDEDSYSDRKNLKVLLVLQVLVRGHKYVEQVGRAMQQVAIRQRGPPHLLDSANGMFR